MRIHWTSGRLVLGISVGCLIFVSLGAMLTIQLFKGAYPAAPPMPPVVATPIEDLLARYEDLLRREAPAVLGILQLGLTDAEIDRWETRHGFKLTGDLRALYRWRNGSVESKTTNIFPNHNFLSLQKAIDNCNRLRKHDSAEGLVQRWAPAMWLSHRESWLGLIVDHAGDGYFLDPNRLESQGSFFFCFLEDGSYVFYPAFRNYLAAIIEGRETGIFVFDSKGVTTTDFVKAQGLWLKYGAMPLDGY